ncbi:hypothetical protein [Ancylobacter oerskovii]|uniref:Mitochondrial inner membrane protein n=1 Tax=Ancylobacter oerskovii TaxID=459519 RepID=A0ABW4YSC7_9HYPH|nr:hypothetical protein [Ancylobacter oerskovii]MBS7545371.1 hypothetical protein [Ancylobacter oerskovii]
MARRPAAKQNPTGKEPAKPDPLTPAAEPAPNADAVSGTAANIPAGDPAAGTSAAHEPAAHEPAAFDAEPVEAAAAIPSSAPRRRPVTLDLPAKDLTPPPPPPPRTESPAAAGGGGAETAGNGRKRQSLGLVGASMLALAAGVLGGAVAFALVSTFYSAEQNIDSITELEARALDLRQRVERLEARADQPATAAAPAVGVPAELTARIEALEGGLTAADAKITAADGRITALAEAPAAAAAPAASPEALAQAEARLSALEGRIGETAAQGQNEAARVAALENRVNDVTAQRQAGAEAARAAAGLATLGALQAAMAAGVPYEAELRASRTLLGDKAAGLSALDASANAGLPTGPVLAGRLKAAMAEAPTPASGGAAPAPADAGLVDKLWNSASSLVSVRRSSGAGETSSEPAIKAADDALMRGDVAEALTILNGLPEVDRQKLAGVIGAMEARQAALAAVAGVNRQLIVELAGRTP